MDEMAIQGLTDCMERYDRAVRKMAERLRPGDGVLGFGRDPRRDPSHMDFYEAMGETVGRLAEGHPSPEEAEQVVRFLLKLSRAEGYHSLTQPMREAVQGHARVLVPFLEPETAQVLAAWYRRQYPRRRLPVPEQLLEKLERRARGR